jgi:hypothetical protein
MQISLKSLNPFEISNLIFAFKFSQFFKGLSCYQDIIFCHTLAPFSSPFKGQLAVAFKEWIC